MNWINQEYMVSVVSLPRWGWGLIIAILAAMAALAVRAIIRARARTFAADHEITQAFIREMRLADVESAPPPQDGPAGPDDLYAAAPAIAAAGGAEARPVATRPGYNAGPWLGDAAGSDTVAAPAVDSWENALERITRAEDALVAASDPAAFYDWLAADWAAYLDDAETVDDVLSSGAWASSPWVDRSPWIQAARQRALVAAQ